MSRLRLSISIYLLLSITLARGNNDMKEQANKVLQKIEELKRKDEYILKQITTYLPLLEDEIFRMKDNATDVIKNIRRVVIEKIEVGSDHSSVCSSKAKSLDSTFAGALMTIETCKLKANSTANHLYKNIKSTSHSLLQELSAIRGKITRCLKERCDKSQFNAVLVTNILSKDTRISSMFDNINKLESRFIVLLSDFQNCLNEKVIKEVNGASAIIIKEVEDCSKARNITPDKL